MLSFEKRSFCKRCRIGFESMKTAHDWVRSNAWPNRAESKYPVRGSCEEMSISSKARLCWVEKRKLRSSGDRFSVFVTYFYGNACFLILPYFHTNASFSEWDVFADLGSPLDKNLGPSQVLFLPKILEADHSSSSILLHSAEPFLKINKINCTASPPVLLHKKLIVNYDLAIVFHI